MEQCRFLGLLALPDGSCAQWYAGTASFLAVLVALGGHFLTVWRQEKDRSRQDAATIAGISMLLTGLSKDIEGNSALLFKHIRKKVFWGKEYLITTMLGSLKALTFQLLDKDQIDVLIRLNEKELAQDIYVVTGQHNLLNMGLDELSQMRADLQPYLSKYVNRDLSQTVIKDSEEGTSLQTSLEVYSHSVGYFERAIPELATAIHDLINRFNEMCQKNTTLEKYSVDPNACTAALSFAASKNGAGGT